MIINLVKLIGFDFGMKYIGIAVGQSITLTATPVTSLKVKDGIPNWNEVASLIAEWKPSKLIVGLPLNMDGSSQALTSCAQKFVNRLYKRYHLPVDTVDERLSTWEAKQYFKVNPRKKEDLGHLNATAAAILVEQWLHSIGN